MKKCYKFLKTMEKHKRIWYNISVPNLQKGLSYGSE